MYAYNYCKHRTVEALLALSQRYLKVGNKSTIGLTTVERHQTNKYLNYSN